MNGWAVLWIFNRVAVDICRDGSPVYLDRCPRTDNLSFGSKTKGTALDGRFHSCSILFLSTALHEVGAALLLRVLCTIPFTGVVVFGQLRKRVGVPFFFFNLSPLLSGEG